MELKICANCNQELSITEFNHESGTHDGRKNKCKACLKEEKRLENLNSDLSKFKARELIQELRNRGYKGVLTFTQEIKL